MRSAISEFANAFLEVLYPPRCAVCDEALAYADRADGLCRGCRGVHRMLRGACCMRCGRMLRGEPDAEYCPDCLRRSHSFDRVFPVFLYESSADSLYRFKYAGRREYAAYYADAFVRRYRGIPRGIRPARLIPVPLHPEKERKRGYNQALLFARALSERTGIPVGGDLVRRVRNTPPQKRFDYAERRNNLKNAFIMSRNDVEWNSVALVDDIFTTGSTADELSALLKDNGVRTVYVFAVAAASGGWS